MTDQAELLVDKRLRAAVLLALANDANLASLDLRVGVLNAIVHLCGSAPTPALWERASHVAGDVPGVRAVVNRICAPGAPHPTRTIHLNQLRNK